MARHFHLLQLVLDRANMVWESSVTLVAAALALSNLVNGLPNSHPSKNHYPGWAGIKHIFAL